MSNVTINLERLYRNWLGERISLTKEVAKIKEAYETLDEKRARIARISGLMDNVVAIMTEVSPSWDPAAQKGTGVNTYKFTYAMGEMTRMTMDKLRMSPSPLRISEIVTHVVVEKEVDREDKELMDRLYRSIDGTLRSMRKRGRIGSTGDFTALWYIVGRPGQDPNVPADATEAD